MRRLLIAVAALISAVMVNSADATPYQIEYQLNNVTFADGGTATGNFTVLYEPVWSDTFSQLLSVDITTTAGTSLSGAHYNGPNFGAGLADSATLTAFISFDTDDLENVLAFNYDPSIPITPDLIIQLVPQTSLPGERESDVWRAITSGTLVPVTDAPEPSTWLILLSGLGCFALLRRRSVLPS